MTLQPLTFLPILKPKVWGGRRLARLGKALPGDQMIGESWEIADLPPAIPGGRSVVADGPWRGRTLRDVIGSHRFDLMGSARLSGDGGFPLLIKFLDARENLSVQVHPDAAYAAAHPAAYLKSEAWVVLNAEPGAVIYNGVRADVTREAFARHIRTGEVANDLVAVPAIVGECHYLPSGTCHALGAGVLVAEVQTPSDTTFRVYDWGRTERELHVEEALQCIRFGGAPESIRPPGEPSRVKGLLTTPLCETEFFTIERIDAQAGATLEVVTGGVPGAPVVWIVLAGRGAAMARDAESVALGPGTTILFPAALKGAFAQFDTNTALLQVMIPSSVRGFLA